MRETDRPMNPVPKKNGRAVGRSNRKGQIFFVRHKRIAGASHKRGICLEDVRAVKLIQRADAIRIQTQGLEKTLEVFLGVKFTI